MSDPTDPIERAVEALRVLNPAGPAEARTLLDGWAHRATLNDEQVTEVLSYFPAHPTWCVRPAGEAEEGIHVSRRIPAYRGGDVVLVELAVTSTWPPHEQMPPTVWLYLREEGVDASYALPLAQARILRHSLGTALRMVRDA